MPKSCAAVTAMLLAAVADVHHAASPAAAAACDRAFTPRARLTPENHYREHPPLIRVRIYSYQVTLLCYCGSIRFKVMGLRVRG